MSRLVALLSVCLLLATCPSFAASHLEFTATDTTGEELSLSALFESNKLVLINFWLAGCGPSCELLPYVQALQDAYECEGLQCLMVYCYHECTADLADHYLAANNYTMPIIEDRNGELQHLFCVSAFPHTVIVDKEGELLLNACGYCSGSEVRMQEVIHQELLSHELPCNQMINLSE